MISWLKSLLGVSQKEEIDNEALDVFVSSRAVLNPETEQMDQTEKDPEDTPYYDFVDTIKQLKREGKNKEAIHLLLECIGATEEEASDVGEGWGVAPWYYEQLAILYRKDKEYQKEVDILERYAKQPKSPGVGPQKLAERLKKAKMLAKKSNQ